MRSLIKMLMMFLLLGWISTASSGPLIVIQSDVDTLEPGDVIDGAATLELPVNTKVTLVTPEGVVMALKGPYKGRPDESQTQDEKLLEILRKILKPEGGTSLGLAVFRSVPGKKRTPWAATVTRSGTYCVRTDEQTTVRRSKSGQKTTIALELVSTGKKVSRSWPAGESTLVWPAELPLVDGENYFAHLEHAIGETEITLRLIPTTLATDAHRAAWMGENGCLRQAQQVLRGLARL